jgi:Copper transport outer membrane protein, MctB
MFDFRYHVVSLAAVFLALLLGILVGVGISSTGSLKDSDRKLLDAQIASVQANLDRAQASIRDLRDAQRAADALADEAYPVMMRDRLRAKRVAVLYVGGVDGRVAASVDRALVDAGAPPAVRLRALKVPVDPTQVDTILAKRPAFAKYLGDDRLDELGRALAEEFVSGGDTPLWQALSGVLVAERSGSPKLPADGVVVVRSASPQQGATARFLNGFYSGLGATGVPAVGVERAETKPSAIAVYRRAGLSSVDDVDALTGRLALALLLAGAQPGHYGIDTTSASDGVLPPVQSLPRPPATTVG